MKKKNCKNCRRTFFTNDKRNYCTKNCSEQAAEKKNEPAKEVVITNTSSKIPVLKVVKGDLFNTIKRTQRTADFLTFCHANLWNDKNFSEEQENYYKRLIAEHFEGSTNIDVTFRQLIERVVIAKRMYAQDHKKYIDEPEYYLDNRYAHGLLSTLQPYEQIIAQRKTIPFYELSLSIFSEAILKFCNTKNILDFISYRDQFVKLHKADLLQMCMNAIVHIQFLNFQH